MRHTIPIVFNCILLLACMSCHTHLFLSTKNTKCPPTQAIWKAIRRFAVRPLEPFVGPALQLPPWYGNGSTKRCNIVWYAILFVILQKFLVNYNKACKAAKQVPSIVRIIN